MTAIELRRPPDADNFRVAAGRFGDRFYTDPLPADDKWGTTSDDDIYPAISTVKKAVGTDWSRAVAKRLAKDPSQLVEIGQLGDEFERKERLNLISDRDLNRASERGTVVHAHAEALLGDRIPIYQLDEVTRPYIKQLDLFFAAYNPTFVGAEFVAIHRTLNNHRIERKNTFAGFGGTGDAVIEIDGKLYLVDWKSRAEDSPHKAYSEEAGQVSAYGRADYWIVADPDSPTGCKRIEPMDLEGGLIVSIKPDSYECFPIDLDAGFEYWRDLHAWWQGLRSERVAVKRKWAPRAVPETTSQLGEGEPDVDTAEQNAAPVAEPAVDMSKLTHHTPTSNRQTFDGMTEVQKNKARERFKQFKLNPNDATQADRVARILNDILARPSLREMQEERAEAFAAHTPEPAKPPVKSTEERIEDEGGEATDELVGEARLVFDMVLDERGKEWTGFRVTEANDAGVGFRISELRTMRRAYLYIAVSHWAAWRQSIGKLATDEQEGNLEFAAILFGVDQCEDGSVSLGARLGGLSNDQAEELATSVKEVVQSETGDQPVTETEANQQST